MLMPEYVVHVMEGRARLRHPVLAADAGKDRAMEALAGQAGVKAFFPGHSSLLLMLDERADLAATMASVCAALEAALPELKGAGRDAGSQRCAIRKLAGETPRQMENRALLAALGASAILGLTGNSRAHVWTAAAFGLLVTRHIWARRRGM